jgi:dTDP-4-amino-4,6-dideoxygalactose transaminase
MPFISLIEKNLMYNIVWYLSYKTYDFFKLWRIIIFLSRKLKLITEILSVSEKSCNFDNFYLDFPNALAYLFRKELKKLDKYTTKRLDNIKYYIENLRNKNIEILFKNLENYNWFRFPILLKSEEQKNKLIKLARQKNIIFWSFWSWINIAPVWSNLEKAQYKIWSCPIAEDISKRILTLPNHKLIIKKDLGRVIDLLNEF